MNHSAVSQTAACRVVPPVCWGGTLLPPASLANPSDWPKAEIPAKTEGRVPLTLAVAAGVPPGRYVVPVDVALRFSGVAAVYSSADQRGASTTGTP